MSLLNDSNIHKNTEMASSFLYSHSIEQKKQKEEQQSQEEADGIAQETITNGHSDIFYP